MAEELKLGMEEEDLSGMEEEEREERVRGGAEGEAGRPFDLGRGAAAAGEAAADWESRSMCWW